jgi:hypothetical protein
MRIGRRGVFFSLSKPQLRSLDTGYCSDDGLLELHMLTPNSVLVNTWNQSSFPAYKSRLWNKEEQAKNKAASSGRA